MPVGGLQRDEMVGEVVVREQQRQPAVRLSRGDAEPPAARLELDQCFADARVKRLDNERARRAQPMVRVAIFAGEVRVQCRVAVGNQRHHRLDQTQADDVTDGVIVGCGQTDASEAFGHRPDDVDLAVDERAVTVEHREADRRRRGH